MQLLKNILLVNWNFQNSDALDHAIMMAKRSNAALRIVELVESHDDRFVDQMKQVYSCNMIDLIGHHYGKHRHDALQKISTAGLRAECRLLIGASHHKILNEVKQNHHDLVIVGVGDTHVQSGVDSATIMNLVRRCAVPVWVVKPREGEKSGRILAAVDPAPAPGPFAESENTLNTQIMEAANTLAEIENRKVDVVHCWLHPMEDRLRRSSATTEKDIREALSQTRRSHKRWLNLLLEKTMAEHIAYRVHLMKGKPHELIPDFARKHQIDLVIMGNVSRPEVNGLFIGNTAEKILCQSDLSMLVIKPNSFIDYAGLRLSNLEAACVL